MTIALQEGLRGLFYAPFYSALALGAYAEEGADVKFVPAPRPGVAQDGLYDGTADVIWGGPMRVNQLYEQRSDCDIICFGEAVTRDPFMLIGRTPRPGFTMADLKGVRLATVAEVPTPWLCLQEDVRRAGIDPASLDRVDDRNMGDNMAALRSGTADVVQLFQPFAEQLIEEGSGHLWYAAANRGPCSYTTFYTRRPVFEAKRDELQCMVRGLYRTQKWIATASPARIAEVVAPFFEGMSPALLTAALARYQGLGIWNRSPVLPRDGYERLVAGLISGNFAKGTPYEIAVDNSLSEQAVRDDPPSM